MKKGIILTDRDIKVLCYLFEQKVACFSEIKSRFFDNSHRVRCIQRLQKLIKYKFIDKSGINDQTCLKRYYTLTRFGLEHIKRLYDFAREDVRLKSDSIQHDLDLSIIRNKVESCKIVRSFYSENYLQNCSLSEDYKRLSPIRDINADAALHINGKSGDFFISFEYESFVKNHSRYTKKFTDYYLNSSITAAFYLCKSDKINDMIKKADREVSESFSPKIFTLSLEKMKKTEKLFRFTDRKNNIFLIE